MSLTVTLAPAILNALEEEASARSIPCDQIIREALEQRYSTPPDFGPEYEIWFRNKVEEGLAAARQGRFVSDEEFKRRANRRRNQLLQLIENQK